LFAAPFSWTTALPRVGLCVRWRLIAASVVPQAIPMTMPESNHEVSSLAVVSATCSSRSMSFAVSGTGTTKVSTPKVALMLWPSPGARLLAARNLISTSPVSRARLRSLETVDREVCRCRAMTSIFMSWR